MKETISEQYREQNRLLHEQRDDYGRSGKMYAEMVDQIAASIGADRILDFGCGKCTLSNTLPHRKFTNYDPAIEGLDDYPEPHDFVTATDVLEHIEPELLDNVLDELQRLTKKVLFVTVATRPAAKTLPDGRNAHLIVQPAEWWLEKLMARFRLDTYNRVGDGMFIATFSNRDWRPGETQ